MTTSTRSESQSRAEGHATGEVVLKLGSDGHFRAGGSINGETVAIHGDTGATAIAIPKRSPRS